MNIAVELAQFFNGRFSGWQSFDGFVFKREAWNFIKSHGYKAEDKNDKWMVSGS